MKLPSIPWLATGPLLAGDNLVNESANSETTTYNHEHPDDAVPNQIIRNSIIIRKGQFPSTSKKMTSTGSLADAPSYLIPLFYSSLSSDVSSFSSN